MRNKYAQEEVDSNDENMWEDVDSEEDEKAASAEGEEDSLNNEENLDENNEENLDENSEDEDSEAELYTRDQEDTTNKQEDSKYDETYIPTIEDKKEFTSQLDLIKTNAQEMNKKMKAVLTSFSQPDKGEIKYGISYLDAKNNLMLSYLIDMMLYSLLKLNNKSLGVSFSDHPIVKRMIYVRTLLEKTKVIDLKLKTQIDRLLKLGEKTLNSAKNAADEEIDENNLRPRILDDEDEEGEENKEEGNNQDEAKEKKKLKYKVQRDFQEFFETATDNKKRKKQIEKMKDKVRGSEMYKQIREEFNDAPQEISNNDSEYNKFMKQVEDYEEDHFTRIKVPKSELKKLKKMERKDNDFDDIGKDFKNMNSLLHNEEREELEQEKKFLSKKRAIDSFARGGRGGRGSASRGRGGSFGGRGSSFAGASRGRGSSFGGRGGASRGNKFANNKRNKF